MPLIEMPVPKRNPSIEELAQTVGKGFEQLAYVLNGFLGSMNIKELTADKVKTGTLLAALVTIQGALANGGYIQFDENGMTINDGTKDTFRVGLDGKPVMTGGIVQSSASGYPRLEFNSEDALLNAARAIDKFIKIISSDGDTGAPALQIRDGSLGVLQFMDSIGRYHILCIPGTKYMIESYSEIILAAPMVEVPDWTSFRRYDTGENLGAALNSKADAFTGFTGTLYMATTAGGPANVAKTFVNGILVS
ncbi:hypothetical protein [Gorillibacterium timonense]|uniref:hypothetical protein n=1 Tax=Gorillibacterium timonense TaxID=1689269 RepID=UPI00071D85F9|nr:hypothetical protein [Gorillibacterium timonense]